MYRVMVVDDDRTSRRGLITLMPWQENGMEVVAEAANGREALEYLSRQQIDVVFADFEMPIMTGIELTEQIRARRLDVRVVIVTVHEEFELVQRALRLGAIDFIAKNRLEESQLGDTLRRVRKRLDEIKSDASPATVCAIARLGLGHDKVEPAIPAIREIDEGLWVLPDTDESTVIAAADQCALGPVQPGFAKIVVHTTALATESAVWSMLRQYARRDLYYDYTPERCDIVKTLSELQDLAASPSDYDVAFIWTTTQSVRWLYDDATFAELVRHIEEHRVPAVILKDAIHQVSEVLDRHYPSMRRQKSTLGFDLTCWCNTLESLRQVRREYGADSRASAASWAAQRNLLHGLEIMLHEYRQPLTSRDVATRVNMSKSHFDAQFRRKFGLSFHEKLIEIRVTNAQLLLEDEELSVKEVALRSGYTDERHFAHVFRSAVGLLPSEFRRSHGIDPTAAR